MRSTRGSGVIGQTLSASAFIVLAIALVAETFDRFRVNAVISTILIAIGMGFVAATDQEAFLPGVTLPAGMTVAAALLVTVYRERGFLAAWIAGVDRGSAH